MTNKYVADLYTNKPKTTVAIIFGSQDSVQIAKLEQALLVLQILLVIQR